tara:strand:- start:638 stop:1090 length:453 start_codon:yes stop_codon:yes gene_type:complete
MKNEKPGLLDYIVLFLLIGLMFFMASCTPDDEILIQVSPTLEIDGNLPMDTNGYYHLQLNQDTNQTIHTVSGTVGYTEYWDEPLKVSWDSNLTWVYQGEDVSTSNQASYVVDGKVHNVIAPINTMLGDTLILTATIREHLITDTIKIVLE